VPLGLRPSACAQPDAPACRLAPQSGGLKPRCGLMLDDGPIKKGRVKKRAGEGCCGGLPGSQQHASTCFACLLPPLELARTPLLASHTPADGSPALPAAAAAEEDEGELDGLGEVREEAPPDVKQVGPAAAAPLLLAAAVHCTAASGCSLQPARLGPSVPRAELPCSGAAAFRLRRQPRHPLNYPTLPPCHPTPGGQGGGGGGAGRGQLAEGAGEGWHQLPAQGRAQGQGQGQGRRLGRRQGPRLGGGQGARLGGGPRQRRRQEEVRRAQGAEGGACGTCAAAERVGGQRRACFAGLEATRRSATCRMSASTAVVLSGMLALDDASEESASCCYYSMPDSLRHRWARRQRGDDSRPNRRANANALQCSKRMQPVSQYVPHTGNPQRSTMFQCRTHRCKLPTPKPSMGTVF
jgi:hypothetical protein